MNEQQFGVYLESLALLTREEAHNRREDAFLRDMVSNMVTANGLNTVEYRKWSSRVRSSAAQLKNNVSTIQLMQRTSTGALNEELDTYIWNFLQINPDKSRHDVPWDELLKHTNKQFLPSNDKEYVRESLENFRQVSGESMRDYTRKFRDLSEQGFPSVERSPDQVRTLIRFFIKGLNSADIAKTVLKASPASVSEAMSAAIDAAEMEETLHRLGHRKEEPMDISSVKPAIQPTDPLLLVTRQLERLTTKMAAMEVQMQQSQPSYRPPRRQSGKNRWTPDGKPICYNCHNSGHISRVCPRNTQNSKFQNQARSTQAMDISTIPSNSGPLPENY